MPAKIIFTEEKEEEIVEKYKELKSYRELELHFGYNKMTLKKVLKKHNIESFSNCVKTKNKCNSNFFSTLTPESSYYLGLILADGSIVKTKNTFQLSIALNRDDGYILEKFKKLVCPENSLIDDRHLKRFSVGDQELILNIVQWGIRWKRKSYNLDECEYLFNRLERSENLNHFIRGYMDGDGCICISKKGNECISFVGTGAFIRELQKRINKKINSCTGSIREDKRKRKDEISNEYGFLTELRYTGRKIVCNICEYLYNGKCEYYLKRKYEKYLSIK